MRRALEADWTLERLEREYTLTVLEKTNGHQGRAAAFLGIDRRTLYRKLRAMGVNLGPADAESSADREDYVRIAAGVA